MTAMITKSEYIQLMSELRELKAMVAQLGPVNVKPSIAEEVAACRAQGRDIGEYFKEKGRRMA